MIIWMKDVKSYLLLNKVINTAKTFSFSDFKEYYKVAKLTKSDLTILKFSDESYIIQIPWQSKAQIIIHKSNNIDPYDRHVLEDMSNEVIDLSKNEKDFFSFFVDEISLRKWLLLWIIGSFVSIPYFIDSWLLNFGEEILKLLFPLIWIYFTLMVVFLASSTLEFNMIKFKTWKVNEYYKIDRNLWRLSIFTMWYILLIYSLILLLWKHWYYLTFEGILIDRYIFSFWLWLAVFFSILNFINLIEYHLLTQQQYSLWSLKDDFFEVNFNNFKHYDV